MRNLGSNLIIHAAAEWAEMALVFCGKPGIVGGRSSPCLPTNELLPMFSEMKMPDFWTFWTKTSTDWASFLETIARSAAETIVAEKAKLAASAPAALSPAAPAAASALQPAAK